MRHFFLSCCVLLAALPLCAATPATPPTLADLLPLDSVRNDTDGNYINAHGGGILEYGGRYYWYGEHRPQWGYLTDKGVVCYSSTNLRDWQYEGVALAISDDEGSDIAYGCIMERPKVVYNAKTEQFVLWFHLELKGQGYDAARAAVAVSSSPTGPFRFLRSGRVNAGLYPQNMPSEEVDSLAAVAIDDMEMWTPAWETAAAKGAYTLRDLAGGQMARDMTIYIDDDGTAYHIYASEENFTLQIAELDDTYTAHTGRYIRVAPMGHNEAPTIFKHAGTYWMITSGCTGWEPNAARLFAAPSLWGPWTQYPNPCRGNDSDRTFGAQGTFVLPLSDGNYIFMADIWHPRDLMHSEHLWLPIQFDEAGTPFLEKE